MEITGKWAFICIMTVAVAVIASVTTVCLQPTNAHDVQKACLSAVNKGFDRPTPEEIRSCYSITATSARGR